MPPLPAPVTLNASIDTPVGETPTHAGADVLLGQALRDLIAERIAQVDKHGFTIEGDQGYAPDVLARAAFAYLDYAIGQLLPAGDPRTGGVLRHANEWPWGVASWRPRDPRANLVKAGALIWAALDRLDHAPRDTGDDRIAA